MNTLSTLTPEDRQALERAFAQLEAQSLAMRIANRVGMPVQKLIAHLPAPAAEKVHTAVRSALHAASEWAVSTIPEDAQPQDGLHTVACALTGGVGGFFGLLATAAELPVSTMLMLHSIAEIARCEGEDLSQPEPRLACMEVFALGGGGISADASDAGYYGVRAALAGAVTEAARHLATRGLGETGGPVLVRLLSEIASRFGLVVSEKVAAQAVPVLGAVGGAGINVVFMRHFQDAAHGHFTVRRLERRYGPDVIRAEYENLRSAARGGARPPAVTDSVA